MATKIGRRTKDVIRRVFDRLDYRTLGEVYCYEGGREFWLAKRTPCLRLGTHIAEALLKKLPAGGRSLYVGAGVPELPALITEALELERRAEPYNLRRAEVSALNRACRSLPITFHAQDGAKAKGTFDHLWIVSVLNDPERF